EIAQSLERGEQALRTYASNPADPTPLKHARNHIHQAAGAIQMVGLDAVSVYTDEIERQLARFDDLKPEQITAACATVPRACRNLKSSREAPVGGVPPIPLKLYPEYDAMQRMRGTRQATPTDLFYPEPALRAPALEPVEPIAVDKLPSHLVKQRRSYQRSLL